MTTAIFKAKEFADAIKRRRGECGLSFRGLMEITGVWYSTLHRCEHGQGIPDAETIDRLCNWLDVPVSTFFERELPVSYRPTESTPDFVRDLLSTDKNFDQRSANALADLFAGAYRHFANA